MNINKWQHVSAFLSNWPLFFRPRRSRFGQSNSLPTTSCLGASVSARRSLRQFQMPSRSLPGARLGLLGSAGLLGPPTRSSSSTPTGPKQGRQVSPVSGRASAQTATLHISLDISALFGKNWNCWDGNGSTGRVLVVVSGHHFALLGLMQPEWVLLQPSDLNVNKYLKIKQ